jgi:hypothetical protein
MEPIIHHLYSSQKVGSLNKKTLSFGNLSLLIPQRRIWRQSKIGTVGTRTVGMSCGLALLTIRIAVSPAILPQSARVAVRPPTLPRPNMDSKAV